MPKKHRNKPGFLARAILARDGQGPTSPQNLLFDLAVGSLRSKGIKTNVSIISNTHDTKYLIDILKNNPTHMIYLHWPNPGNPSIVGELSDAIAELDCSLVLLASAGIMTSDDAHDLLSRIKRLDAVFFGEVESTLSSVACALQEGRPWRDEPGLWVRRKDSLVRTRPRPPIDLDLLPRADTHSAQPGTERQVLLGRGCNSNCSYCGLQVPYRENSSGMHDFWRSRNPRHVVDEMEELWRKGINRFILNSYVFFGYGQEGTLKTRQLADEIISRKLSISFSFVTHPGHLRRNVSLLPLLREAGLEQIILGIDSITDRARRLYKVSFDEEDILLALEALHRESINFRTVYIFYDPYLSIAEIKTHFIFFRSARTFYKHMPISYSAILHHQALKSALQLRMEMPIVDLLRSDGLLVQEGTLEKRPAARFRDPLVGRFFHLHRSFNREILRHVSPLLFNAEIEKLFPDLAFFLLNALEEIRHRLVSMPDMDDDEIMSATRSWCRDALSPVWLASREPNFPQIQQRELVDNFLADIDRLVP